MAEILSQRQKAHPALRRALLTGQFGAGRTCMWACRSIIGANGVEKIVEITLNKDEQEMFDHSVDSVKGLVDACKKIDPSLG
jgi:malate dehydrogenase